MLIDEEIRQALREFILATTATGSMLGTVLSVDENEMTCTVEDDDVERTVRLRPVLDGKEGLTIFPKTGTWCLAVRIEDDGDFMAIGFGEVDRYRLKIGTCIYEITADGFVIKKGGDNLLDVIDDLAGQLKAVNEKLQAVVVAIGVSPDVPGLQAINVQVENNRSKLKRILK